MSTTEIVKLTLKKRGRKYFDCTLGRYRAKLVINPVSAGLETDHVIRVTVHNLSTENRYGTNLKFEPVEILEDRTLSDVIAAAAARRHAENWLGYAESDADRGNYQTNAIVESLKICAGYEQFADRIAALRKKIEKNKIAAEAERAEEEKQRVEREKKRLDRVLFPEENLPRLNTPIRYRNEIVVFESTGKSFRIAEYHPSTHGEHLLGYEGDWGCYCYYRPATAQEIAQLDKR